MNKKFHEKLIQLRPELIGMRVWFCPNTVQKLECIVNENGSVSVVGSVDKQFQEAKELVMAISTGAISIPDDFVLPRKRTLDRCWFSTVRPYCAVARQRVSTYGETESIRTQLLDVSRYLKEWKAEIMADVELEFVRMKGAKSKSAIRKRMLYT